MFEKDEDAGSSEVGFLVKVNEEPNQKKIAFSLIPGRRLTIGRSKMSCDIVIRDPSVSREHAYVEVVNNIASMVRMYAIPTN